MTEPAIDLTLMDGVFDSYAGQPGALIPILQKTQELYNYLPPEALNLISERLGIALGKIYGVATFYAQFYLERRGRHILKVCNGTACHVKGAPGLLVAVEEEFGIQPGQTSPDGQLTTEVIYCLGSCALAPATVLDGKVTGRTRPDTLLKRVRKQTGAS